MILLAASQSGAHAILTLGFLLCAALVGGLIAQAIRLPRVTAYLLVGLLFGPHTADLLPPAVRMYLPTVHPQYLATYHPLGQLAMALVLFNIGCHFPLVHFRRILRRVVRLSASEIGLTFALVFFGLLTVGVSWELALLFGALALATAPATTILVLKENESEGPVTEYATALVALNNLAAIVVFEVLFRGILFFRGSGEIALSSQLGELVADLLGSVAVGVVAGLLTAYACGLLSQGRWLVLLVAMATLVLGVCEHWDVPYLIAFLAMGATVANASDRARSITAELDRLTGLLCVIFFVIHGAELNLKALYTAGIVGLAYIVLRCTGKYVGVYFAADAHHDGLPVKQWLGATLLAQAGAAIALSGIAADGMGTEGKKLQSIILGTVVFFELIGPILIRVGLLRAGEVPMSQAIRHTTTTPLDELRQLLNRVLSAFGINPYLRRDAGKLTVRQLMRTNVESLPAAAKFDQVVQFMEHSHENIFPVIGDDDDLLGVIRYANLRHALFDRDIGALVCAEDLAVPTFSMLYPDDLATRAWQQFRHNQDDLIFVVTRDEPNRLTGLVRRRDLLRLFFRQGNNE